jgi:hypothetical protein
MKLAYISSNLRDYTVSSSNTILTSNLNASNVLTTFVVSLTNAAINGDIVDVTIWPSLYSNQQAIQQGYVYQVFCNLVWGLCNNNAVLAPTTTNVGIGTTNPQANLHVIGSSIITGTLSSGQINTQNNNINVGSGTITASNIIGNFTVSSTINVIAGGTVNTGAITSTTITTQNNNINAGSGTINMAPTGTLVSGQINTQNNNINTGSGTINMASTGTLVSGQINTQNNNINAGSGTITSGQINTQGNNINIGTGTLTLQTVNILTSPPDKGFFSRSLQLTSPYSQTVASLSTSGVVSLSNQSAASGSYWRIRAFGTYAAISSVNVRQFSIVVLWGSTTLTALLSGNVLASTVQTTNWVAEFTIVGTSTTAVSVTGHLINQIASATLQTTNILVLTSTAVTAGAQAIFFNVGQAGTTFAGDTITVQSVLIERIT